LLGYYVILFEFIVYPLLKKYIAFIVFYPPYLDVSNNA